MYNPLDKLNLGKSVAEALLDQEAEPLGELEQFNGAGVYAIYYKGDHPAYRRLRTANETEWQSPIYIGKAIPSGGRRGAAVAPLTGRYLHKRLGEHAESVELAENSEIGDFAARWLVVDDIWIPLGESVLISKFKPVWNSVLDGFGNHDPGAGRYGGLRPLWDVLHPGRAWADKCRQRTDTQTELRDRVREHLREHLVAAEHVRFDRPAP